MSRDEAAIKFLYNLLTNDSAMQAIKTPVDVYHVLAKVDAPFPYLVHHLTDSGRSGEDPVSTQLYYLDIWDYTDNTARIWQFEKRITELFNSTNRYTGDGIVSMRMYEGPREWLPVEQDSSGSDTAIIRLSLIYAVRFGI